MTAKAILIRLQWTVWIAIYGGLLTIVLATFVQPADPATAWWMTAIGGVFVGLGAVLIYARSRLSETP